ncbi:MAG: hypothetical protein NVSMB27_11500 [Ktedonobacteraceae bacterium]
MAEKTTFLSRLAGRTLGLVPAVQPMIAPIYAPGRRLAETEHALDFSLNDRDMEDALSVAPNEQATHEQRRGLATSRKEGPQRSVIIPVEQAFPPLVPQESQPSMPLHHPEGPGAHMASAHAIAIETSMGESGRKTPARGLPSASAPPLTLHASPQGTVGTGASQTDTMQVMESLESGEADLQSSSPTRLRSMVESGRKAPARGLPSASTPPLPLHASITDIPGGWESARSKMISSQQDGQEVGRKEWAYEQEIAVPSPAIQVTIGRIEVRAIPPPASRSQQRTGPHVMSLDEYLNQPARGGH